MHSEDRRYELPLVREHEERTFEQLERVESFDRMAFANRILQALRPLPTTVVLYERHAGVHVEKGARGARGLGSSFVMVGISNTASRSHIALALAEVAGVAHRPFMVDLLMKAGVETLA